MHRSLRVCLALFLALAAGLLSRAYLLQQKSNLSHAPTSPVVVFRHGFEESEKEVTPDLVIQRQVPVGIIPESAVTSVEQVVGKIAEGPVGAGEIVSEVRIKGNRREDSKDPSAEGGKLTNGMRAMAVTVDEATVNAGFLKPGDRVDVLAADLGNRLWSGRTIAEDVEVLDICGPADHPDEYGGFRAGDTSVTLAVEPKAAEAVVAWEQRGSLKLARRAPGDHAKRELPPAVDQPVKTQTLPVQPTQSPNTPILVPAESGQPLAEPPKRLVHLPREPSSDPGDEQEPASTARGERDDSATRVREESVAQRWEVETLRGIDFERIIVPKHFLREGSEKASDNPDNDPVTDIVVR